MKTQKIILLFIGVLISSCQSIFIGTAESDYQVVNDFAKEVKATNNFKMIAFGGGSFKGSSYSLRFSSSQTPSLDEARAIFYNTAIRFLNKINADKKLREEAEDNLFTVANLSLKIFFQKLKVLSLVWEMVF